MTTNGSVGNAANAGNAGKAASAGKWDIGAFAFVAGYTDVIGFIALAGLFTAHVTGNLIMIGVESVGSTEGLFLKVLALPVFVGAVALARLTEKRLIQRGRDAVVPLIAAETLLLAAFAGVGLRMQALGAGPDSSPAMLAGFLAVAAMAIQNALSRTSLADLGPTTIMTGNSTQVIIDLVDLPSAPPEARGPIRARLGKMVPSVLSFAVGAILGALAYTRFGYAAVALPIVVLFVTCVRRGRSHTTVPAR
ncbi:Uncharacterized membrane protein YoaK, UPF0700 family [Ralstonia sp. 25mfcol4.1]|uniref:YoaK family protein n=1 Tax=Burkholderiaceae TaxID=119060 RepID=UPI000400A5F3|nr:YoaK family protein [Ralstonia sp. 25mfcol4.1]SDP50266.1 Uncharacterized membrane protein YoaK, UPF0700 family [Ralstonia sp. 25mfcol4.1]